MEITTADMEIREMLTLYVRYPRTIDQKKTEPKNMKWAQKYDFPKRTHKSKLTVYKHIPHKKAHKTYIIRNIWYNSYY